MSYLLQGHVDDALNGGELYVMANGFKEGYLVEK